MNECYDYDCHGGGCTFRVKREVVEESNDIFMNDRFTVRCDMSIFTAPYVLVPLPDILQHLRNLLSGEGTDVTFQVGGKTFTAHRCVLAAQSAVFKAELFGPMKEGTAKTVIRIDDMEAKVFKLLLGFMYSDSVPEIEEEDDAMWKHLLVAADRYDFMRLRLICEQKLCTYIGLSTVATILSLAEQHHCRGLKNACLDFLSNPANLQQVVSDDGFDHLTSSCPSVLKEIIARLASLMLDK
uniref:BTB domain-containing protein n=1 Tax=Arundo donax TaxID=35708 RepID=A0A0A9CNZ2_ARUDO